MTHHRTLSRRALLQRLGAGVAATVGGCSVPPTYDIGVPNPSQPADPEPLPPADPVLTKLPWLTVLGPTTVRLRFETRELPPLPVTLTGPAGTIELTPTTTLSNLTYTNAVSAGLNLMPDEAGPHTLHDALFEQLEPGETYAWSVTTGATTHEGTFVAPPDRYAAFRFAFLADTMAPLSADVTELLASSAPHLTLHGGDFEYDSTALDSWSEAVRAMQPLMQQGPFHLAIGNNDRVGTAELEQMYDRLFGRRDDALPLRYHAFTYGGVRFFVLDSEVAGLSDPASAQLTWLKDELRAAHEDPDVRFSVVAFHRPLFTLSRYFQSNFSMEHNLTPLFERFDVRLVLAGHVHGFEHYLRRGVHYVVDGGGGALTYDLEESLDLAEELRPDLLPSRRFASRSQGGTVVQVHEDGSMTVERLLTTTAAPAYTFEIAKR
jgi:hypothetical protein